MMTDNDFWEELHRLLLQEDFLAADTLVREHMEAFDACLKAAFDKAHPPTKH